MKNKHIQLCMWHKYICFLSESFEIRNIWSIAKIHRTTSFLPEEIILQQKEHGHMAATLTQSTQKFLAQAFPQEQDSGGIQCLRDLQEYFGSSPSFGSLHCGHH